MSGKSIAIIGAGPVGGILVAHLLRGGSSDVAIIDLNRPLLDEIQENGLVIEGRDAFSVKVTKTFVSLEQASQKGEKFDVVFVCVKTTAQEQVAQGLPFVLDDEGTVISFQNGLDTEIVLANAVGPDRTLRGVVNYAGNVVQPGHIRMTFFNPPNYIGAAIPGNPAADARAREVSTIISRAGLSTDFSDNIRRYVWEKVIRNAALMPVSTLTGMDMAEVMGSEYGLHLVKVLLKESIEVAAKAGFQFDDKFYDDSLTYFLKAGHHMPSMYNDVQNNYRTEMAFLNHKIAEYGENHGVPTPYNRALASLVLSIDELILLKQKK